MLNVHFYLTFKLNLNVSLLKGWKEINHRALGRTRLPLDKELRRKLEVILGLQKGKIRLEMENKIAMS